MAQQFHFQEHIQEKFERISNAHSYMGVKDESTPIRCCCDHYVFVSVTNYPRKSS